MFGIGTPEIIGIVIITLLVYGPDKLPQMIKKVVGFLRQLKNMSDEVTTSVSKEIHRIERSQEIQEARHMIEQNRKMLSENLNLDTKNETSPDKDPNDPTKN